MAVDASIFFWNVPKRSIVSLATEEGKPVALHVADLHALSEGGNFIVAFWDEFLGDEAFETCADDGAHDSGVIDLLGVVDLVAAGDTAGVVVSDASLIFFNSGHEVAFHDLHVVDVVEQLESLRAYRIAKCRTPWGFVALVVRVVDLTVEEFHHHVDLVFFGGRHEALDSDGTVLDALFIIEPVAIAGKADEVRQSSSCGLRDDVFVAFDQSIVMLQPVPSLADAVASTAGHGAGEAVLLQCRPVFRLQ